MRNKAPLVLMEQLIMLLVFALAAAACLGIFASAGNIRAASRRQDDAVLLAQTGAEMLKHCGGDISAAARMLGGDAEDNAAVIPCQGDYLLHLQQAASGIPGLGTARIWVTHADSPGEVLFSLDIAWQEVD